MANRPDPDSGDGASLEERGPRLVAIIGATASGKSDAAILVAKRFGGEVINADSRLFYSGMEIGTARPSDRELNSVPHHMIGFLSPEDGYGLSKFLVTASSSISEITARGSLPVLAGGTGQYVWGLLEGWQVPEVPPDPELRAQLERELEEAGVGALYSKLKSLDPAAASKVDGKNHRRVIRALERFYATQQTGVAHDPGSAIDPGYDCLLIGLYVGRAELHRRISERIDKMLASGWVDEVRRLREAGIDFNSPALSAIGYREIAAMLDGEITPEEARDRTIHATNRLVRHQNNWFKRDDERIHWIDVTDGEVDRVLEPVEQWLAKSSSDSA